MHSALYEGKVRHRRLAPVPHEFDYTMLMVYLEGGRKIFDATMTMTRVEITGRSPASALLRWPFMTLFVVGGIHWQALKLWIKGVPLIDHPNKRGAEAP